MAANTEREKGWEEVGDGMNIDDASVGRVSRGEVGGGMVPAIQTSRAQPEEQRGRQCR